MDPVGALQAVLLGSLQVKKLATTGTLISMLINIKQYRPAAEAFRVVSGWAHLTVSGRLPVGVCVCVSAWVDGCGCGAASPRKREGQKIARLSFGLTACFFVFQAATSFTIRRGSESGQGTAGQHSYKKQREEGKREQPLYRWL